MFVVSAQDKHSHSQATSVILKPGDYFKLSKVITITTNSSLYKSWKSKCGWGSNTRASRGNSMQLLYLFGVVFKVLMITFNKASGYVPMETIPQVGDN